jgi:hypothetical protein
MEQMTTLILRTLVTNSDRAGGLVSIAGFAQLDHKANSSSHICLQHPTILLQDFMRDMKTL